MGYVVKKADIYKDKSLLLKILKNNRDRINYPYEKRYDWIYYENPYGLATAWIIWDEKNYSPAGFTSVYPRVMLVNGKEMVCWNCGDFSIEKKYRTLGIALKLRKEAKISVDEGRVPFLYAHPNNRMVYVHLKAGHKQIAIVKRFALPVRIDKYLEKYSVAKIFSPAINSIFSKLLKFKYKRIGEYQVSSKLEMDFNDSFRGICDELNREFPVIGLRDKVYLTWKYKKHPIYNYELFTYYEKGKLSGYILFTQSEGIIYIAEIITANNEQLRKNVILTFLNHILYEREKVYSITTVIDELNPVAQTLQEVGFKYRDDATSSAIAYSADPEISNIVLNGRNWFLTLGDRDS